MAATPQNPQWRTAPGLMRSVAAVALAVAGVALGIVALALMLLGVAPIRQAALDFALAEINKGETKISIGDIEGSWPDRLIIRKLTVGDAGGAWLTLDSAALDWRPSALLRGEVHIVELDASGLSIPRAPGETDTTENAASGFALPVLPFSLRIDAAHLESASLGRALAEPGTQGMLAALNADARLGYSRDRVDFGLKALRTDNVPGRLDAQGVLDLRHRIVTLNVSAEDGAAGRPGLAAMLGHIEGASRVTLTAAAQSLDGAVSGEVGIDGGDALRLTASAKGRWDAALDVDFTGSAAGAFVARNLADFGHAREARASGKLQWRRDDTLSLTGFSIEAGRLALTGDARLGTASVAAPHAFDGQGTLTGLDLLLDKPGSAALSPLGWQAAGKIDMARGIARLAQATATGAFGEMKFAGDVGFDGSVKGAGEADVKDAAPLGAMLGQKLAGAFSLKVAPFAMEADGSGGGDFTVESQGLDAGDARLNRLIGGQISADGSLLLTKEGGIAIPSLTVTPATGAYRFHATASQGATGILSGEASFTAENAATLLPGEATGKLDVKAQLAGNIARPRLSLAATLARGSVAGVALTSLTLNAVAAQGGEGPLAIRFDGPRGKATLDAKLGLPDAGGARLDAIEAEVFGAKFAGALALSPDGLASGAIKGENVALKPFSDLAGMTLGGTGDLTLAIDAHGGKQNATLAFAARRLDLDPGVAVMLDHATLDAALTDLFGKAAVDARLSAMSGQAGITHLTKFDIRAQGPLDRLALAAEIAGTREAAKPLPLSLTTRASFTGAALNLEAFRLALGEASAALAKPARIELANGIAAKGFAIDMRGAPGAGLLTADFAIAARSARLHVEGKTVPLDLAALLMPVDAIEGTASGSVDLDTARGTGALALRFDEVAISQGLEGDRPAFNATVDGQWAKGRFDATARAQGVSTEPFDLTASLPVVRDPKGAWPMPAGRGPVSAKFTWEGPIASLAALADIGNQQISGAAQVALTVSGDVSAPLIDGTASLTDGSYENFDSGTLLKHLTLKLEGSESRSLNFTLDADDGEQGKVKADGMVSLVRGTFPAISINASFADAHLVRRSDADVSVDGALQLLGPRFPPEADAPLTLKGKLTTTNAQIRIPESIAASIPEIDVVEINGVPSRAARAAAEPGIPLQLGIELSIGKPARVSGRGLDSLWSGDLEISGPAEAPAVTGTLTSLRGAFDFAGKTFTLTKGAVRFLGETPIDPNLDIALDYKRSDLAATVSVTGQSSSPSIALSSTPDLPRDELLARILFNKGVGELSATEGVQLANTLAQLSGNGFGVSGAGILDRVQQSLGLDVLRIDSAQSGATTVSAGKYIEKRVYVGVEQGALASDSSVKVEITVTPQISVDTRIGQNASGDVGINWKWDY